MTSSDDEAAVDSLRSMSDLGNLRNYEFDFNASSKGVFNNSSVALRSVTAPFESSQQALSSIDHNQPLHTLSSASFSKFYGSGRKMPKVVTETINSLEAAEARALERSNGGPLNNSLGNLNNFLSTNAAAAAAAASVAAAAAAASTTATGSPAAALRSGNFSFGDLGGSSASVAGLPRNTLLPAIDSDQTSPYHHSNNIASLVDDSRNRSASPGGSAPSSGAKPRRAAAAFGVSSADFGPGFVSSGVFGAPLNAASAAIIGGSPSPLVAKSATAGKMLPGYFYDSQYNEMSHSNRRSDNIEGDDVDDEYDEDDDEEYVEERGRAATRMQKRDSGGRRSKKKTATESAETPSGKRKRRSATASTQNAANAQQQGAPVHNVLRMTDAAKKIRAERKREERAAAAVSDMLLSGSNPSVSDLVAARASGGFSGGATAAAAATATSASSPPSSAGGAANASVTKPTGTTRVSSRSSKAALTAKTGIRLQVAARVAHAAAAGEASALLDEQFPDLAQLARGSADAGPTASAVRAAVLSKKRKSASESPAPDQSSVEAALSAETGAVSGDGASPANSKRTRNDTSKEDDKDNDHTVDVDGKSRRGQLLEITDYLSMPQGEAATAIGIPASSLSKRWSEAVADRKWPHRTVAKLNRQILALLNEVPEDDGTNAAQIASQTAQIEKRLTALLKERQEALAPVFIRITKPDKLLIDINRQKNKKK